MGSSPRVRGAVRILSRKSKFVGIIPARAGSSVNLMESSFEKRDHPRACGEQANALQTVL